MNDSHPPPSIPWASRRLRLLRVFLLGVLASLTGCGLPLPLTDGATRLAEEIGYAAKRLRHSPSTSIEIEHSPYPFPEGVKGRYEIRFQESLHHPGSGGSLLVSDLDSRGHKLHGYNWSTTYHLNYVRVPGKLSIRKQAGEATVVVLERRPDGAIEVTALR